MPKGCKLTESNIEVNPAAMILKGLELLQEEINHDENFMETLIMLRETAWDLVEWLKANQIAGGNIPLPWTEWKHRT